ncbi:MAG: hypothetical protein H7A23_21565 [Leptospiraceae bacterium]|nr:hypothetical protein [Leptospiraceae bacterium]MCP5497152.1 hypothetical protein [Leptospiraceae bacterium]
MLESDDPKKGLIPLPVRLILTAEGVRLFSKNRTLVKTVKNKDGHARDGIEFSSYNANSVQKLVMNAYLEEIYVCLPDLLSSRKYIIDTNSLVIYGNLYKKLSPSLATMVIKSKVVQDYNRKNPKNMLVDLDSVENKKLEILRKTKQSDFETMEMEITNDVVQKVINNPTLEEEDRLTRIKSLPKFMRYIDPRIWYFYYIIYQTQLKEEVRNSFSDMIIMYLDRTKLATHLSNLLMEFIQNAERSHFYKILMDTPEKVGYRRDPEKFFKESENRKWAIAEAKKRNQMLELSWNVNADHLGIGHSNKILISVTHEGAIKDVDAKLMHQKMKSDTGGVPVSAFYKDSKQRSKVTNTELGLLYISYIEEICRKENIRFYCNLYSDQIKDKTTIRMEISL